MASRRICLWLVFMIIMHSAGEDTRSILMSLITGSKFQCTNTTCLPFVNIITSTIMKCQMACLAQIYCRAASFHQSTSNCELFNAMSNEISNMATDTDITTMIVIAGTRFPPGHTECRKTHPRQHQPHHQQQHHQPHPHPQQPRQRRPHHQQQQQHQQQVLRQQHQQQHPRPQQQHPRPQQQHPQPQQQHPQRRQLHQQQQQQHQRQLPQQQNFVSYTINDPL
ncbi:unnamed protein product [Adineta steineri]|uniref:Apple domain-containing protein n=1 Tax=Adineta steineri TaxID=433720 RepID=A0A815IRP6_9BILA|nr:unnamed protein product [Adineta steineri]